MDLMDVPLADAVAAVRDELLEAAARAGADPQVVFAVGPVEMQFEVELHADRRPGFVGWFQDSAGPYLRSLAVGCVFPARQHPSLVTVQGDGQRGAR
ncbi:trypco2 family protein [Kitasatospora sp. NPDC056327]|uniref:trypco2 family protein n=1 Tax=Kitasatospora sp. NPDC056327 TaxID=3345785 RepID=UPI0035D70454